ncbi:MAG: glycosyltransferase family 39 protein [Chitinophagales bacterium]|nr:glycosyltransferase family 39 protein [Chitinophagales bacterium]
MARNKQQPVIHLKEARQPVKYESGSNAIFWWLLVVVLLFVAVVRLRLLGLSLERDEGEYAFIGQLLLKGFAPFENAYNMKFPGTSLMYALFMMLFGETQQGIHAGFLIMNAMTIILLFVIVRKYLGNLVAIVTAATYGLITISPAVLGSAAHATHFVVFFAAGGTGLLLAALKNQRRINLFLSGLLFGLGILMKQSGVFFVLFAGMVFLYDQLIIKRTSITQWFFSGMVWAAGVVLPVAGLFLWMSAAGTFSRFWFWTMEYGSQYASVESWSRGWANLQVNLDGLQHDFIFLWLLAPVGLLVLWTAKFPSATRAFVTALTIVSVLAVFPGLYFRQHYFVLFIPAFSLLAGIAIAFLSTLLTERYQLKYGRTIASLIFLAACLAGIVQLFPYLFQQNMFTVSRSLYGGNPFPEALTMARYIKSQSAPEEKIAILGSEPEILFYADRLSATGYIYTYSLMEEQAYNVQMQKEMIAEIENGQPQWMVFCRIPQSWLMRDESPQEIFDWIRTYSDQYYDPVGIMEIPNDLRAGTFYWNEQIANFKGTSDRQVYVFKRKKEAAQ